jgi:hypothetical protein
MKRRNGHEEAKERATALAAGKKAAAGASPGRQAESANKGLFPNLADRLYSDVEPGVYSELAAYTLAVASSWAYSNPANLVEAMDYIGFENRPNPHFKTKVASKTVRNGALLVETTTTFLQSGKVAILCFRGTEPTNILEWLSNMSFEPERFYSSGTVHSGFYLSLKPLLPFIQNGLEAALKGCFVRPSHTMRPGLLTRAACDAPEKGLQKLEALYITGHSLGAALAALTAAMIFTNSKYAGIRDKVRGVYTFGQPLIGDKVFCDTCQDLFGERTFRHVYERDVVPELPPRLYGNFYTFGHEYVSTPEGWTRRERTPGQEVRQAGTLLGSVIPALLAWYVGKVPFLRSKITLPVSIADHEPVRYIACSRISLPFYG